MTLKLENLNLQWSSKKWIDNSAFSFWDQQAAVDISERNLDSAIDKEENEMKEQLISEGNASR